MLNLNSFLSQSSQPACCMSLSADSWVRLLPKQLIFSFSFSFFFKFVFFVMYFCLCGSTAFSMCFAYTKNLNLESQPQINRSDCVQSTSRSSSWLWDGLCWNLLFIFRRKSMLCFSWVHNNLLAICPNISLFCWYWFLTNISTNCDKPSLTSMN